MADGEDQPQADARRDRVGRLQLTTYAEFKKASPAFKLDDEQVNAWDYLLVDEGHNAEAIDIMKLNPELYPKWTNAWDALGEGYRSSGDTADAIRSYQKALEVDPHNAAKQKELKDLQKQPSRPRLRRPRARGFQSA